MSHHPSKQPQDKQKHPTPMPSAATGAYMRRICYFSEDIDFSVPQAVIATQWLQAVIQQEGYKLIHLNFIFCSDHYLHQKNIQYLEHDTFTDVITFNHAEVASRVEGDIYISIDRVRDNAQHYQHTFMQELYIVMVHGVLHLLGYDDKTPATQALMRQKESTYVVHMSSLLDQQALAPNA
jgi:probable rRNA maturation factor